MTGSQAETLSWRRDVGMARRKLMSEHINNQSKRQEVLKELISQLHQGKMDD